MNSKNAFYKNKTEALRKVREDMYISTVQAMNRVKDPDGKVPSAIISIMAESDLKDMMWHTGEVNEETGKPKLKVPRTFRLFTEGDKINFSSIKVALAHPAASNGVCSRHRSKLRKRKQ